MKYTLLLSLLAVAGLATTTFGMENKAAHEELTKAEQRVADHCKSLIDCLSCKNARKALTESQDRLYPTLSEKDIKFLLDQKKATLKEAKTQLKQRFKNASKDDAELYYESLIFHDKRQAYEAHKESWDDYKCDDQEALKEYIVKDACRRFANEMNRLKKEIDHARPALVKLAKEHKKHFELYLELEKLKDIYNNKF